MTLEKALLTSSFLRKLCMEKMFEMLFCMHFFCAPIPCGKNTCGCGIDNEERSNV